MVLTGVFELPAGLVAYFSMIRGGRRTPLFIFNGTVLAAALATIPILLLDMEGQFTKWLID